MGKSKMHIGSRYFYGNFPLFTVDKKIQLIFMEKWKMKPSKDRAILRLIIPESISFSFANEVLKYF